ncbi:hypothetical protein L1987_05453 [Smallanthus sonchifolius]|uniref:Uncharacterized protein n=1 Tax=Smallanthus sonchifolius TaxID=185202 RepID=A0ACB9JVG5_9ASTR|nr:hypothetical protein L1987_05453 [Smallanthus sonchifolius]
MIAEGSYSSRGKRGFVFSDTMPEDWDEKEFIPDPENKKPKGYDDIPKEIHDPYTKNVFIFLKDITLYVKKLMITVKVYEGKNR